MQCHAPTCLTMELWNNHTGELVCRQRPIYGGTGDKTIGHKFDEPGCRPFSPKSDVQVAEIVCTSRRDRARWLAQTHPTPRINGTRQRDPRG